MKGLSPEIGELQLTVAGSPDDVLIRRDELRKRLMIDSFTMAREECEPSFLTTSTATPRLMSGRRTR